MKASTLKRLVIEASERSNTKQDLLEEVIKLICIFEQDQELTKTNIGHQVFAPFNQPPGKVPYHTICSCNPANGGSGICGCVMGNKLVDPVAKSNIEWTSTSTQESESND